MSNDINTNGEMDGFIAKAAAVSNVLEQASALGVSSNFDIDKAMINTLDGSMDSGWSSAWWQEGREPGHFHRVNPDVAAAISLYKRALMAVPVRHIVRNNDGAGITVNPKSPLSQILNRPNRYMSWAELLGVIIDGLLVRGEFACYIETSGDGTKTSAHPLYNFQMVTADDGSIFYRVQLTEPQRYMQESMMSGDHEHAYIPQRYIVHGRYEVDPINHLRAMTPLTAYANSIGLGSMLRAGQEAFHKNKSQPSGALTTDATLTTDQAMQLRDRWESMSAAMKQGKTPILSNGLKFQPISVSANEAQIIQLLSMTTKDIAKAYGIPSVLLGESSGVTYSNLEMLLYTWRTTGLLAVCQTIEQAFEYTLELPPKEEMIIDIADLARSEAMHQADTLTKLVLNGVMSPNEARARLDLKPIEGVADGLVAQQQVQPLQQTADNAAKRNASEIALSEAHAEYYQRTAGAKEAASAESATAATEATAREAEAVEEIKSKNVELLETTDLLIKAMFKS